MLQLRRILVLVLCCLVFLTGFVVPVSAGKLEEYSGVISIPSQSLGIRYNSLTENTDWGYSSVPASFEFSDNSYRFTYNQLTALSGVYSLVTSSNKEFEFIFNFGDGTDPPVDVSFEFVKFAPYFYFHNLSPHARYFKFTGDVELYCDNELVYSASYTGNNDFPAARPNQTFSVSRYMTLVYRTTASDVRVVDLEDDTIRQFFEIKFENLLVNNQPAQLDRIELNIQNIESDVEDIKVSVENIEEGVAQIQGIVTDMKEQLEDPDSSIWDAAGEKISDTLEDLFVPSPEEIGAVKDGFDNLAKDKLGGAYSAMETVDDAVTDVTRKLHNPDPNVAIEFPGISVPLGGDIGTVTLAEEQPVTLPTELTAILHPVAGTIFSIICGLGTFNVLKDMVECFLSGYSYASYLHRNKGGSDG